MNLPSDETLEHAPRAEPSFATQRDQPGDSSTHRFADTSEVGNAVDVKEQGKIDVALKLGQERFDVLSGVARVDGPVSVGHQVLQYLPVEVPLRGALGYKGQSFPAYCEVVL